MTATLLTIAVWIAVAAGVIHCVSLILHNVPVRRVHVSCRCGRHEIYAVLVDGEETEVAADLTKSCPWCKGYICEA